MWHLTRDTGHRTPWKSSKVKYLRIDLNLSLNVGHYDEMGLMLSKPWTVGLVVFQVNRSVGMQGYGPVARWYFRNKRDNSLFRTWGVKNIWTKDFFFTSKHFINLFRAVRYWVLYTNIWWQTFSSQIVGYYRGEKNKQMHILDGGLLW